MSNKKPNTFIAGVPKGGTTALAAIINQHPQIFVPEHKEPRYFLFQGASVDENDPVNSRVATTEEMYLKHYEGQQEEIIVDASPGYFSSPQAMSLIASFDSSANIILLLRDPVERAFSHFIFSIKQGYEPSSATMEDVLTQSEVKLPNGFVRKRPYLATGYYDDFLEHTLGLFSKDRIYVTTSERFRESQQTVLTEIVNFLNVSPFSFNLEVGEFAKSGIPKNRNLKKLLDKGRFLKKILPGKMAKKLKGIKRTIENRNLEKPDLSEETREKLVEHYAPKVARLQELVDIDLSAWKNFS